MYACLAVLFTVVSLLKLTKLRWPYQVQKALDVISVSLFRIGIVVQTQCWVTFETAFYLRMYFPLGIAGVLGLYYLALLGVKRWDRNTQYPERVRMVAYIFPNMRDVNFLDADYEHAVKLLLIRSYLSFLQVGYTYLSVEALVIFDCITISGTSRIRDFVLVECYSKDWLVYLPTALFGLCAYMLGILVLMMVLLRRYDFGRQRGARELLGRTIMDYKENYRWWIVADMTWRLAIVLVLRFGLNNPPAQISWFLVFLMIRILAHRILQPFENVLPNQQEILLIGLTIGVALFGVVFYVTDSMTHVPRGVTAVFYVGALICIAGLTISTLWYMWKTYQEYDRARANSTQRRTSSRLDENGVPMVEFDRQHSNDSAGDAEIHVEYVPIPPESSEAKRFHKVFAAAEPTYEHEHLAYDSVERRRFGDVFSALERAYEQAADGSPSAARAVIGAGAVSPSSRRQQWRDAFDEFQSGRGDSIDRTAS